MTTINLSISDVHQLAKDCLQGNGCDDTNASAVADTITAAERDGCASHGLFRLPGYAASLKSGKVNGSSRPFINELAGGVLQLDGDRGYAPVAHQVGIPALIERTKTQGIAAMAFVNTHHFSALWAEVEPLTDAGLCAFAFTAFKPAVAPAGGMKPLFGTNPMSFGWPRPGKAPVIFDQASASMAKGEIMIAARDGHTLPAGVGVDANGEPTTDPNEVLKGSILPFGGYKGSAIAMMVELLVAGLIGQNFSYEAAERDNNDGGPPVGGELIIAMDPARFGDPEAWTDHADGLFQQMLDQDGVRLPGARRYQNRKQIASDGVTIPTSLHEKITELTAK